MFSLVSANQFIYTLGTNTYYVSIYKWGRNLEISKNLGF